MVLMSVLFLLWSGFTYTNFFGHSEIVETNPGTFKNMLRVVDSVYDDSRGAPFGAYVYTPPIYSYAYDYLFWWRGETKYKRKVIDSQEGLYYLVMEPNYDKPWEIDGWRKSHARGQTKWTKVFPGDITVDRKEGTLYKKDDGL
jgi:hypothetical protein